MRQNLLVALLVSASLAITSICYSPAFAEDAAGRPDDFNQVLLPLVQGANGELTQFASKATISLSELGDSGPISLELVKRSNESFDFTATHARASVAIRRRADGIAFALPDHKVVFLGEGAITTPDNLELSGILQRLISSDSVSFPWLGVLKPLTANDTAKLIYNLAKPFRDPATGKWRIGTGFVDFDPAGPTWTITLGTTVVRLETLPQLPPELAVSDWPDYKSVIRSRDEIERQWARGIRRATEILSPGPSLLTPYEKSKSVPNGEVKWIGNQRVVVLAGTPEEMGRAHGQLLKKEATRCLDSVLYAFATARIIETGRWFTDDLHAAYARLAPHIPAHHTREIDALADSLEIDRKTLEALNVFPELFHCSGFAVFGEATADGKLYHGRVLDYMTAIGLQDSATVFIMQPEGKQPFANVGYAGFTGCVSGMNNQGISLGEMGGRGEGQWDGVPMATLMRIALEECQTLDQVMDLWKNSPRTCEYYYVFADGNTNRAVGVAALPESIEFIHPGESHERLGPGIPDAVLLSAGDRLQVLRERVQEKHGQIDTQIGQWLMSRPVAMTSNLHNVLFVPEDGIMYVAQATHNQPAADRPYAKIDVRALLATGLKSK